MSSTDPTDLLRDFKGTTEDALRMALQMLYADTADYITRNNLGGMDNHAMRLAREALASRSPAGEPAEPEFDATQNLQRAMAAKFADLLRYDAQISRDQALRIAKLLDALATPSPAVPAERMVRVVHTGKMQPRVLPLDDPTESAAPEPVGALTDEQIEGVAIALWHRFADDSIEDWADEIHKAEYRDAARAALRALPESK